MTHVSSIRLYGFGVVLVTAKKHDYQVKAIDGAHIKTSGTFIGEWGLNGDRKIGCECVALVFDNEFY